MKKCYVLLFIVSFCFSSFAQTNLQVESLHYDSIQVNAGWNLLSLPVSAADGRKNSLFPTAISDAFIYENSYQPKDTLENGLGFWLKFGSAETIYITGETILEDTIGVRTGWNMIGSLSVPVPVDSIKSDPPGIITSEYFGYNSSAVYQETDTIQPGKGYWVKVNQNGSLILTSSPSPCPATVEYAGKTYNTVQIGNQCWLRENLDVGTRVDGSQNQTNNSTIEKYCYNDDPAKCDTFGGFYQWNEAMQYTTTPGAQGICPNGWHIPTFAEFQTLSSTLGGDGNALKEIGQGTGAGAGTNTSGFSALLSGFRYYDGYFYNLGYYTAFWSSTEFNTFYAYYVYLNYDGSNIYYYYNVKEFGRSVRCVKD